MQIKNICHNFFRLFRRLIWLFRTDSFPLKSASISALGLLGEAIWRTDTITGVTLCTRNTTAHKHTGSIKSVFSLHFERAAQLLSKLTTNLKWREKALWQELKNCKCANSQPVDNEKPPNELAYCVTVAFTILMQSFSTNRHVIKVCKSLQI